MATFYKCDRCHNTSDDKDELTKVNIESVDRYSSPIIIKTEICKNCLRDLRTWIQPQAKREKNYE